MNDSIIKYMSSDEDISIEELNKSYNKYYANDKHKELCKYIDKYLQLQEQIEITIERIPIPTNKHYSNDSSNEKPLPYIEVFYNKFNKKYILPFYVSSITNPVDSDWLSAQFRYINSLDLPKTEMIKGWSKTGFNLLKTDDRFDKLFKNAPVSSKPIYLFRNERNPTKYKNDPQFSKQYIDESDVGTYKQNMLNLSYTLSYDMALTWKGKHIIRAKVMPNIPLLMISSLSVYPNEFEVVLPRGVIYYVESVNKFQRIPDTFKRNLKKRKEAICPHDILMHHDAYFTDIVIVGYNSPFIGSYPIMETLGNMSGISNKITKTLKNKLEKIRNKKYVDNIYIDESHRDICNKLNELKSMLFFQHIVISFPTTTINEQGIVKRFASYNINLIYNERYYLTKDALYYKVLPYDDKYFRKMFSFMINCNKTNKELVYNSFLKAPNDIDKILEIVPKTTQDMMFYGEIPFWNRKLIKYEILENENKLVQARFDLDNIDSSKLVFRVLVPKDTPLIVLQNSIFINRYSRFIVKNPKKRLNILTKHTIDTFSTLFFPDTPYPDADATIINRLKALCPDNIIDKTIYIADLIMMK